MTKREIIDGLMGYLMNDDLFILNIQKSKAILGLHKTIKFLEAYSKASQLPPKGMCPWCQFQNNPEDEICTSCSNPIIDD